ncbi:hypothetical protein MRB53_001765 [Persea americana]|uniref:Uncharacterized protein n=1 Tax=Persea americana TaxID=3435 RepID=A0ACC2MSL0_PERAE|nr:hypothetical protein MRB53_001765 [Persea americana]
MCSFSLPSPKALAIANCPSTRGTFPEISGILTSKSSDSWPRCEYVEVNSNQHKPKVLKLVMIVIAGPPSYGPLNSSAVCFVSLGMSPFDLLFKKKKEEEEWHPLLGRRQGEQGWLEDGAQLLKEVISSCDGRGCYPIQMFSAKEIEQAIGRLFHQYWFFVEYDGTHEDRQIIIKRPYVGDPTIAMGKDGLLHKFIEKESTEKEERLELILHNGLSMGARQVEQAMACMEIAVGCISRNPVERPEMKDVTKQLWQIERAELPLSSSLLREQQLGKGLEIVTRGPTRTLIASIGICKEASLKLGHPLLGRRQGEQGWLEDGARLLKEVISSCDGRGCYPVQMFSAKEIEQAIGQSFDNDECYEGTHEGRQIIIKTSGASNGLYGGRSWMHIKKSRREAGNEGRDKTPMSDRKS